MSWRGHPWSMGNSGSDSRRGIRRTFNLPKEFRLLVESKEERENKISESQISFSRTNHFLLAQTSGRVLSGLTAHLLRSLRLVVKSFQSQGSLQVEACGADCWVDRSGVSSGKRFLSRELRLWTETLRKSGGGVLCRGLCSVARLLESLSLCRPGLRVLGL